MKRRSSRPVQQMLILLFFFFALLVSSSSSSVLAFTASISIPAATTSLLVSSSSLGGRPPLLLLPHQKRQERQRYANNALLESVSAESNDKEVDDDFRPVRRFWSLSAVALGIGWFVGLSYFIVRNYKVGPWPTAFPNLLSKPGWVLTHAISTMFFSGGIVLSTIFEWLVVRKQNRDVIKFWFTQVPRIDKMIVLPALTVAIVSGMGQAALDYGGMSTAPKHIRLAIHILLTFALWWVSTDLTSQTTSQNAVLAWYNGETATNGSSNSAEAPLPRVLTFRRWSNVVSCFFVACLYGLMALKPGYSP